MSFALDLINNPKQNEKNHLPSNLSQEVHKFGSDNFPKSQALRMPPLNRWNWIRVKPHTTLQSSLFVNGNQTDYILGNIPGYCEKAQLEFEINVVNNPVTLNMEFLIDRIEFHSNGNIIQTIRDYNLYHAWLWKSNDETARTAASFNKNTSLVSQALGVGFHRVYLEIDCLINQTEPKLNIIKNTNLTVRIFWSTKGVVAGLNSDAQVQLCDILIKNQQLSMMQESWETQKKQSMLLKYRFLDPLKAADETLVMNASQQYNIRLTSLNAASSFLVFHVSLVGAAPDTFSTIDSFELLDSSNQIVGIKTTHEAAQLCGTDFPGVLLTLKPNIYVVPFSFPNLARLGNQSGLYKFTTQEILKIYTPAGWVNGNYNVLIYSYNYATMQIEKGVVSVMK